MSDQSSDKTTAIFADLDGDGTLDEIDDTDGDSVADNVVLSSDAGNDAPTELFLDVDGDGQLDALADLDGDGQVDAVALAAEPGVIFADVDGDGQVDALVDTDGDGNIDTEYSDVSSLLDGGQGSPDGGDPFPLDPTDGYTSNDGPDGYSTDGYTSNGGPGDNPQFQTPDGFNDGVNESPGYTDVDPNMPNPDSSMIMDYSDDTSLQSTSDYSVTDSWNTAEENQTLEDTSNDLTDASNETWQRSLDLTDISNQQYTDSLDLENQANQAWTDGNMELYNDLHEQATDGFSDSNNTAYESNVTADTSWDQYNSASEVSSYETPVAYEAPAYEAPAYEAPAYEAPVDTSE